MGIVGYKPILKEDAFFNSRVIKDIASFKEVCDVIVASFCDVIVANRFDKEVLGDMAEKVYTWDLFGRD